MLLQRSDCIFSLTAIQLLIWEPPSSRVKANMTDNSEGAAA